MPLTLRVDFDDPVCLRYSQSCNTIPKFRNLMLITTLGMDIEGRAAFPSRKLSCLNLIDSIQKLMKNPKLGVE